MATPITGVEKIEIAPIGENGAMPTTGWVEVEDIADGSVSFTVPPVQRTNIRVENVSGVRYVLPGDTEPPVFSAASLDIAGDLAEQISDGTWDPATKRFDAPKTDSIKYVAIRITSKSFQDQKMRLGIPMAAVSMGFAENLTRTGFLQMTIEGAATTPLDADSNPVSPWHFQIIPGSTT
jgi:hypothetical protein